MAGCDREGKTGGTGVEVAEPVEQFSLVVAAMPGLMLLASGVGCPGRSTLGLPLEKGAGAHGWAGPSQKKYLWLLLPLNVSRFVSLIVCLYSS